MPHRMGTFFSSHTRIPDRPMRIPLSENLSEKKSVFFSISSCILVPTNYYESVPLLDDFGDWATPGFFDSGTFFLRFDLLFPSGPCLPHPTLCSKLIYPPVLMRCSHNG